MVKSSKTQMQNCISSSMPTKDIMTASNHSMKIVCVHMRFFLIEVLVCHYLIQGICCVSRLKDLSTVGIYPILKLLVN